MYKLASTALLGAVAARAQPEITEQSLRRWKLLADFKEMLAQACADVPLHRSWAEPNRLQGVADYLSLFLFGLLNPVVDSMRGLCAASQLPRVQDEICSAPVSLGSFSEAQHVLDFALLEHVFNAAGARVLERAPASARGPKGLNFLIQDSTLWPALPRMVWALWRKQGVLQNGVRLHLSLHLLADAPAHAQVTVGAHCERQAWKEVWKKGEAYIGDRYYGEDYQVLAQLDELGCLYVLRLRGNAAMDILEELPVTAADQAQNVLRQAWVRLGNPKMKDRPRVRLVWVQGPEEVLILATNQSPAEWEAELVSLLYRQRWQIELFFRWLKCILGCRRWLAESPAGVAAQIYLALIAALLLQLYTGQRPTRRMMELIQFYLTGLATLEDLEQGLERERTRLARKKKK